MQGEEGDSRRWAHAAAPFAAGLGFFALYASRIDPWVGAADTAKFQLIGATLGTAHAPGYSIYVLLLHLVFRLLPRLTWAASADLVSAFCVAAAVAVLVRLAQELEVRTLPALAAGIAFGSLFAVRTVASEAEVYPLHLLLTAGLLLAVVRWRRTGRLGSLVWAGVLFSFGLSHHPTIVCSLPAALLVAAARRPPGRRLLAWAPLFLFLALAPFAYVVWRSYAPPTSLLDMQAHSSAQLWDGMSGAQHRANFLQEGIVKILTHRVPWLAGQLAHNHGWLLLLAAFGFLSWPRRSDRLVLALLAAGSAAFTFAYQVPDADVYLLPVHLALALAVALGAQRLGDRLPSRLAPLLYLLLAISPALFGPRLAATLDAPRARRLAAIVDTVPARAVVVSFDYPTSMALTYESWERHGGSPRILAIPAIALHLPLATDRLRRHLMGGTPLRVAPDDRLLEPGTPLICDCPDSETREALALQGLNTLPMGPRGAALGLYRMRAPKRIPSLPAAVLTSKRVTVPSLREEIGAMRQPTFDPATVAVRLGSSAEEVSRTPGGVATVRSVTQDAVVVDVESTAGGWLVLTDLYTSRWKISIDGRSSPSFRADVLFPALEVPPGAHRVELRRDLRPFSFSLWLHGPWGYLLP